MKASPSFLKGFKRRVFNKRRHKVFVIGFHKTGTSSMGKALQILGYKVCGALKEGFAFEQSDKKPKDYILEKATPLLQKYEAFQDTPWFIFYKELYEMYPDAYFILTTRNPQKWLGSLQKHFGNKFWPYHEWIYGTLDSISKADIYLEKYNNHNEAVRLFFADKPNFVEFRIEKDGWDKLAGFLEQKNPKTPFPHANSAATKGKFYNILKHKLARIYYKK